MRRTIRSDKTDTEPPRGSAAAGDMPHRTRRDRLDGLLPSSCDMHVFRVHKRAASMRVLCAVVLAVVGMVGLAQDARATLPPGN
jgi:hypothetical protein